MIYIGNNEFRTAKSQINWGNAGLDNSDALTVLMLFSLPQLTLFGILEAQEKTAPIFFKVPKGLHFHVQDISDVCLMSLDELLYLLTLFWRPARQLLLEIIFLNHREYVNDFLPCLFRQAFHSLGS